MKLTITTDKITDRNCPNCGARWNDHTGPYCQLCGEPKTCFTVRNHGQPHARFKTRAEAEREIEECILLDRYERLNAGDIEIPI